MAMRVSEIRRFLDTLYETDLVGIDLGGMVLLVVDDDGPYLEIGGLPEGDDR